jgi:hypothetical protein
MVCLWVVELLSPACPGLVWVVILLHQFYFCHPVTIIFFDPISVENRIWVTGLELRSVDSDSSGLCPVDSEKPVVVIIPKSKDRFIERPPMKTVQP